MSEISAAQAAQYDVLALGCPAMGAGGAGGGEFEPFLHRAEGSLSGRKAALFGSYGWGTANGCATGATVPGPPGPCSAARRADAQRGPDDAGLDACRALGASLAAL